MFSSKSRRAATESDDAIMAVVPDAGTTLQAEMRIEETANARTAEGLILVLKLESKS